MFCLFACLLLLLTKCAQVSLTHKQHTKLARAMCFIIQKQPRLLKTAFYKLKIWVLISGYYSFSTLNILRSLFSASSTTMMYNPLASLAKEPSCNVVCPAKISACVKATTRPFISNN